MKRNYKGKKNAMYWKVVDKVVKIVQTWPEWKKNIPLGSLGKEIRSV